jgi:hypothetical protein
MEAPKIVQLLSGISKQYDDWTQKIGEKNGKTSMGMHL